MGKEKVYLKSEEDYPSASNTMEPMELNLISGTRPGTYRDEQTRKDEVSVSPSPPLLVRREEWCALVNSFTSGEDKTDFVQVLYFIYCTKFYLRFMGSGKTCTS